MAEECVSPEGGTPSFGARRPELVTVDARPERRGAAQPERRSAMVPERRSATRTDRRVATLPARRDDMVTDRRSDRPAERLNSAVPEHGIDTLPERGNSAVPEHVAGTVPGPEPVFRRGWPRSKVSAAQLLLLTDLVCLTLPIVWEISHYRAFLTAAVLSCILFWSADLYRPRLQAFVLDETPALLGCMLAATAIVATMSAIRHPTVGVSTYLVGAASAMLLVMFGRTTANLVIRQARRRRIVQHRSIIVGSGPVADRMAEILNTSPDYGLSVAGYLADRPTADDPMAHVPFLGPVRTLRDNIDLAGAEVILISNEGFAEEELATIVRQALWDDCRIFLVPRLYQLSHRVMQSDMIGSIPVDRLGHSGRLGVPWKCKRIFDIVVSAIALILLSPLLAATALAVRIDGGPGILFRQVRVGRDGRPFELVKFRSLRPADEDESLTQWSIQDDDRLTRVGRFVRRTSLDELPQLWTILRGDMTIVGPRPERPHFVEKFSQEEPTYSLRHRVPAGLTGLAQVNGMRGNTSISERSYFDNYYIDNWSLWMDTKVILRTFSEVFFGSGG